METQKLLESAKTGFANLEISEKYKDSALDWLEIWLTEDLYKNYAPQIEYLIMTEKWAFLLDSF